MKKILLILFVISLSSCHRAFYTHDLYSTPYGIDYREGKWLLNEIESPEVIKPKLTEIAFDGFYKKLGDQLQKVENLNNIHLIYVPINPDKMLLGQIKKESNFDYFINIKSKRLKNDIGSLEIGNPSYKKINSAETTLEVYDLNTLEIIYSRKVIGEVKIDDDNNEDFAFVQGTNSIMIGCLKKIMKRIK